MRSAASICFILLQAFVHYSTSLPARADASPCDLFYYEDDTDVTLFCDQKNTSLVQIKNALISLDGQGTIEVELYQVDLGTIPNDFFKGHNIKILTIAFCNLDGLTDGNGRPLEGLEDTLEVLMIKGSLADGHDFDMSTLSHLRNLREVTLQSNSFKEINNSWFKNAPPSLRTITLSDNGIQKLGDRVFADASNLEFLFMSGNAFSDISRSMFPNPTKLYRVELDNNLLTSLPGDLFTNMPSLKRLSMSKNSISRLPEKIWVPLWNRTEQIDLSENPLECDDHMDWMLRVPTCAEVSATCDSPSRLNGRRVPQLRDSHC